MGPGESSDRFPSWLRLIFHHKKGAFGSCDVSSREFLFTSFENFESLKNPKYCWASQASNRIGPSSETNKPSRIGDVAISSFIRLKCLNVYVNMWLYVWLYMCGAACAAWPGPLRGPLQLYYSLSEVSALIYSNLLECIELRLLKCIWDVYQKYFEFHLFLIAFLWTLLSLDRYNLNST